MLRQPRCVLYAGLSNGSVLMSNDGPLRWGAIDMGLSSTSVRGFLIDPDSSTRYAGTFGGGVYADQLEAVRMVWPRAGDEKTLRCALLDLLRQLEKREEHDGKPPQPRE